MIELFNIQFNLAMKFCNDFSYNSNTHATLLFFAGYMT